VREKIVILPGLLDLLTAGGQRERSYLTVLFAVMVRAQPEKQVWYLVAQVRA